MSTTTTELPFERVIREAGHTDANVLVGYLAQSIVGLRTTLAMIADAVAAQRVDGLDRQAWIENRCLEALK